MGGCHGGLLGTVTGGQERRERTKGKTGKTGEDERKDGRGRKKRRERTKGKTGEDERKDGRGRKERRETEDKRNAGRRRTGESERGLFLDFNVTSPKDEERIYSS